MTPSSTVERRTKSGREAWRLPLGERRCRMLLELACFAVVAFALFYRLGSLPSVPQEWMGELYAPILASELSPRVELRSPWQWISMGYSELHYSPLFSGFARVLIEAQGRTLWQARFVNALFLLGGALTSYVLVRRSRWRELVLAVLALSLCSTWTLFFNRSLSGMPLAFVNLFLFGACWLRLIERSARTPWRGFSAALVVGLLASGLTYQYTPFRLYPLLLVTSLLVGAVRTGEAGRAFRLKLVGVAAGLLVCLLPQLYGDTRQNLREYFHGRGESLQMDILAARTGGDATELATRMGRNSLDTLGMLTGIGNRDGVENWRGLTSSYSAGTLVYPIVFVPLLLLGLGVCIVRARTASHERWLLVFYLVAWIPCVFTKVGEPNALRLITAVFPTFGIIFVGLRSLVWRCVGSATRRGLLAGTLATGLAALQVWFFFSAPAPFVTEAHQGHREGQRLARSLATTAGQGPVLICLDHEHEVLLAEALLMSIATWERILGEEVFWWVGYGTDAKVDGAGSPRPQFYYSDEREDCPRADSLSQRGVVFRSAGVVGYRLDTRRSSALLGHADSGAEPNGLR